MQEAQISYLPPEQKQVSEKFLDMLFLPNFQKALGIAAEHTAKTGLETGFIVEVLPDSHFWIEDVRAGGTEGMSLATTLKEIDGPGDYYLTINEYFRFHFHPEDKGTVIPSPSDLTIFKDKSGQPEYMGVGKVDREGKVTIFVIIKPKYRLIGFDIRYYRENVQNMKDYKELQNLLSTIGLRSFVVEVDSGSKDKITA